MNDTYLLFIAYSNCVFVWCIHEDWAHYVFRFFDTWLSDFWYIPYAYDFVFFFVLGLTETGKRLKLSLAQRLWFRCSFLFDLSLCRLSLGPICDLPWNRVLSSRLISSQSILFKTALLSELLGTRVVHAFVPHRAEISSVYFLALHKWACLTPLCGFL